MSLHTYHQKRNFKKTHEPTGKIKHSKNKNGLFIIQKHAASHLHYDFRLELNNVLISWAIPKGPCLDPAVKRLAVHVEDHPLEYGSFEGIIPKGQYGGGTVMLWDKGEWISEDSNSAEAYHKGNMTFTLNAEKLHGRWKLIRINNNDKTWLLIKIKDKYSQSLKQYDITKEKPNSVISKQSINEITENAKKIKINLKSSSFPKKISPELATLVDEPPSGTEWLHEIKLDGYRLIAFKEKNKIRLMTRNNNNWTEKFLSIAKEISKLPIDNIILDGEVVVLDENQHSNFQLLQNSIKDNQDNPFIYFIFDLIYYDKYNLTKMPLIERKNILHDILLAADNPILQYSDHILGSGKQVLKKTCEMALEGIVSKNSNSQYIQKRTRDWLKIKCIKSQEFIIGGFTPPQGNRSFFGSLFLGTYNKNNELIYNGNVGTGFTDTSLKNIYNLLKKNKVDVMPFKKKPLDSKNATWVKPILVAEIEFTQWTKKNFLRHPSFKGLRSNKSAKNVIKEISPHRSEKKSMQANLPYKLTNPNKILYSKDKFTKQDIANYYDNVSEWILPYINQRPLTLVRCPDGYENCFFQKHINESTPSALHEITTKEKDKNEKCIYIDDYDGLMSLPQLAVLEIHSWGSRIENIEYPDMIVFDLDPAPNLSWKKIVLAAFEIKQYLSDFKLHSFVKTTGGKGLHIIIPIKPEYNWDEVKKFSQTFVNFITIQHPDKYINKMTKSKRIGKIFVDYLRNQRGSTAIAPYSTRARLHAPVATPISWDELTNDRKDTYFTIQSLPHRLNNLSKDPWEKFFKLNQSLHLDKL